MAEITLKNGKIIPIDVKNVKVKEWRAFVNPKGSIESENALISNCTGLTADEIDEITFIELREIVKAIILAMRDPLIDPN